jgi:hypothetical protein
MQKMVINKARMSELNGQAFGLLRGWVQAEFIGFSDEHTFILALMFYLSKEIYAGVYGKDLFTLFKVMFDKINLFIEGTWGYLNDLKIRGQQSDWP